MDALNPPKSSSNCVLSTTALHHKAVGAGAAASQNTPGQHPRRRGTHALDLLNKRLIHSPKLDSKPHIHAKPHNLLSMELAEPEGGCFLERTRITSQSARHTRTACCQQATAPVTKNLNHKS